MSRTGKSDIFSAAELGQRLRDERGRLGMSQEAFGKLGGVKRETQYLYERGLRTPSMEYLFGVVAGGVNLEFLVFGEREINLRGKACIDPQVALSAYDLVEEFAKDSKGKPLNHKHRKAVFNAICQTVAGRSQDEVDWKALRAWPSALARSKR